MSMRLAIAILALLLVSHVSAEPDSNDLTLDAPANHVAMAAEGGFFGVGIDDAKQVTSGSKDLDTWFLHQAASPFATKQAGGADPAVCNNSVTTDDDCDSDVVFVAISKAGADMVAASQATPNKVVLVFITLGGGDNNNRAEVEGVIRGLAMSDSGNHVAAAIENYELDGDPLHKVYAWDGQGNQKMAPRTAAGVPKALDISRDGARIIVAAGSSVQIMPSTDGGSVLTDSWSPRTVEAVAFSGLGDHRAAAANDRGAIRIYADDQSGTPKRQLNVPGGQTAATAIGVSDDGSQVALAIGETLRIWHLAEPLQFEDILLEENVGAAIRSLQYGEGYLLAGTARTALMYDATESVQLWKATVPSDIAAMSMDNAGDRLAVAFGSKVRVYEMVDEGTLSLTGSTTATPGARHSLTLDIANTGDRLLTGDIVVDVPAGITVDTDESVSLLPGKSKKVTVGLDIPSTWPVGELVVTASVGEHEAQKTLQVAQREAWSLSTDDATSKAVSGGSATFDLKVRNDGNVAGEPPLQTTVAPSGWSVELADVGQVAPGAQEDLEVRLIAPANAANLARGTATIGLPGQLPIELVGTVGASFQPALDLPAQSVVEAGESTTVQATLRNAGNTLDSFDVAISGVPSGWSVTFADGTTEQTLLDLSAGETRSLTLEVAAPTGITPITYSTTLTAISHGDRGSTATEQFSFSPEEEEKESPGIGILAILAIALVFAWRRR